MICLTDITVEKSGRRVLAVPQLRLGERRVAIIGRNGSGKSTLARLLNGLEAPTRGQVTIAGDADRRTLRRHVGFVFQNPDNQIVYPIVREDLEFGLKNLKLPEAERRARIEAVLARFDIADLADRFTHELSGGEKQLVALAGVMVMRPATVVFDEPTTLLDLWNKQRLTRAIDALPEQVILVTHDLDLIAGYERVLLVENGEILADGSPQPVIAQYLEMHG